MRRWFILWVVWLMPLQFAWTAASAYCQHETRAPQTLHLGHHAHAHQGEPRPPGDSPLMADADCASCHAVTVAALPATPDGRAVDLASPSCEAPAAPAFTSAPPRAPDRPQWRRLV